MTNLKNHSKFRRKISHTTWSDTDKKFQSAKVQTKTKNKSYLPIILFIKLGIIFIEQERFFLDRIGFIGSSEILK